MSKELTIFKNAEFGEIRAAGNADSPLFCLADVCRALDIANSRNVKNRLRQDGVHTMDIIDSMGRKQNATFIDEPNLYKCIFMSRKAEAEKFQDWVTNEVLPTIRKHGAYLSLDALERGLSDPDYLIMLAQQVKQEKTLRLSAEKSNEQHQKVINQQQVQINNMGTEIVSLRESVGNMEKKVSYLDMILGTKDAINVTQIAADYGISARKLNQKLHEMGIQYFVGGQWVLYDRYKRLGYTSNEIAVYADSLGVLHSKQYTKWTQRGRLFLYEQLKKVGSYPLVELQQMDLFHKLD